MQNGSVKASVFFGRKKITALLEKRLESFLKGYRQNVGVTGAPLVGKTFLLRFFFERLSSFKNEIIPVFFSCQEYDSFERFSEKWMAELLSGYQRAFSEAPAKNIPVLFRTLKSKLPKTLARMKLVRKFITKKRLDQAFQELLSLTGLICQESGRRVLVIIDDFDRLAELGLHDPFSALGKEIMVQKETMFVVSGSRLERSLSIFREKLSLLFANFEVIKLGPFDFDESRGFINSNFHMAQISDELKRFLIRMTDGHPYYLHMIAKRFECGASGQNERRVLIDAFYQELFSENGALYQYFRSILNFYAQGRPWTLCADVLTALSLGYKKLSVAARFLGLKATDVNKIMEKLVLTEGIQKHGNFYQVPDTLFRFWLEHVYYRKRFWAERSPLTGTKSFQEDIDGLIEDCTREDKEELPKRISSLFLKFQNDSVQIDGRKFNCPHFTEVTFRPNNGRVFPVLAKNSKARWLCQILSHPIAEEDVQTFLADVKHYKAPFQKKLVIGLKGIDLNAKLLAQEAKIQYLDLKTLNLLFDLYDEPKLVF